MSELLSELVHKFLSDTVCDATSSASNEKKEHYQQWKVRDFIQNARWPLVSTQIKLIFKAST